MDYKKLLDILIRDDAYSLLKENESQVFDLLPEFKVCKGFEQKNRWHIYDVYEHILHVIKGVGTNRVLRLTALFHDIGKPIAFTLDTEGIGHFYNHWNESIKIFDKYIDKFDLKSEESLLITDLIFYHDFDIDSMSEKEIDVMIDRIRPENIHFLFDIKRADLLAQSKEFHFMIKNIDNQERRILSKCSKLKNEAK